LKEIIIAADTKNQRLDKFLSKYLNTAPKSFIYKMIRKKNIKLNGKKAVGSEILAENDVLQIYISDKIIDEFRAVKKIDINAREIDIVYENEHVLIINKPRGLLSQPSSSHEQDTVLSRALAYLHKKGDYDISAESVFTPGLCNRLDRNTTGIILCAKTLNASQQLNKAIAEGKSEKYYLAIVIGKVSSGGLLEGYHTKDAASNKVSISTSVEGKSVLTEYMPIAVSSSHSLLKVKLLTGRSHQIRAHLAGIGHPIFGDEKYGSKAEPSPKYQMLHSTSISFLGLENELAEINGIVFEAAPPEDFIYYRGKFFGGLI